ncbi:MAG: alcohol dehydrogenase catalytic domain-containing protein [Bacteroidales bacterium]|jgi:threonine dehydrogenase-like Zn-dependent dehydrogenase|nr:alcohol dehydrogenase catalytic domain-containing protein [Bacteroidales bacterium]
MKALVFDISLTVKEIPCPQPRNHEVLIKILFSAICNTDLEIIKGYMGFKGVPGHEFVGEVMTRSSYLFGKKVVGEINCSCGECYLCQTGRKTHCPNRTVLGIQDHQGVFAEYIVLPEENLKIIPDNIPLTSAVFTEPLAAAIEIFEQIQIKPSQNVYIFGAGKLGLLISQLFRLNGCLYTTFDTNEVKVKKALETGINASLLSSLGESDKAEVCVDCTGNLSGINLALSHLYPRGKLILKTTVAKSEKIDLNQIVINEFEIIGSRCGLFEPALSLLSQGLVNPQPLITAIFSFNEILKAFETAEKPGSLKVLIQH